MHHVKTGALSISRLEYGADVIIEPDHLDNFYLIQIPTQGYAEIEFGSQKFISYSQVASSYFSSAIFTYALARELTPAYSKSFKG